MVIFFPEIRNGPVRGVQTPGEHRRCSGRAGGRQPQPGGARDRQETAAAPAVGAPAEAQAAEGEELGGSVQVSFFVYFKPLLSVQHELQMSFFCLIVHLNRVLFQGQVYFEQRGSIKIVYRNKFRKKN